MATTPTPTRLSKAQLAHLQQRITDATSWTKRNRAAEAAKPKKPAAVTAAERLIQRHREACDRAERQARKQFDGAATAAREMLLFSTPEAALRAVKALEKKFAKLGAD